MHGFSWRDHLALAATVVALIMTTAGIAHLLHRASQRRSAATEDTASVDSDVQDALLPPPDNVPLRKLPSRFPRDSYLPKIREGDASGSIDMSTFSAGRDLIYFEDARIWWESDNDEGDDECDHTMHRAAEPPLRRLVELVAARDGTLEVHDAYRASGIHNRRSLHREGRAVDVTCDELGLETLAKLCWAAGFDWVYHEVSGGGGAHVHVSVRRDNHRTLANLTRKYYADAKRAK